MLIWTQNPVPKKPWTGLLDGKLERINGCAQKNLLIPNATFEGEEDCLYLNVYRPAVSQINSCNNFILFSWIVLLLLFSKNTTEKRNSSLPVIVYIHEGGFFSGSIHTLVRGPQYFMDTQQVILVLMTYRLGVLGMYDKRIIAHLCWIWDF